MANLLPRQLQKLVAQFLHEPPMLDLGDPNVYCTCFNVRYAWASTIAISVGLRSSSTVTS